MTKVDFLVTVDIADFTSGITRDLDHESLEEVIKQIDQQVSDYDFTKRLRDYFVQEMRAEESLYADDSTIFESPLHVLILLAEKGKIRMEDLSSPSPMESLEMLWDSGVINADDIDGLVGS